MCDPTGPLPTCRFPVPQKRVRAAAGRSGAASLEHALQNCRERRVGAVDTINGEGLFTIYGMSRLGSLCSGATSLGIRAFAALLFCHVQSVHTIVRRAMPELMGRDKSFRQ